MAAKNYYEILGVDKNVNADELKLAYRKLAKKYHPDMYVSASEQEKKDAEAKFKDINHAYEVLSDPQKRAAYDTYGDENGPQPGAGGFGSGFSSGDSDSIWTTFSRLYSRDSAVDRRARKEQTLRKEGRISLLVSPFPLKRRRSALKRRSA